MKKYLAFTVFAAVAFLMAQVPKPGSGGAALIAGTDYGKPSLYDTVANIAAAPCASADTGRIGFTSSVYTARCNGASWTWFLSSTQVFPPVSTGWSWDNQASSTIASSNGYEYMATPKSGTTSVSMRYRTSPSTPYTVKSLIRADRSGIPPGSAGTAVNVGVGVAFRDSGGKLVIFHETVDGTTTQTSLNTQKWTTSTSVSATYTAYGPTFGALAVDRAARGDKWYAISDDGTNLKFYWSLNGIDWNQFDTRSRTDWMASGPNAYGFFAYANGGAVHIMVLSIQETASGTP